ncbi:MAG: FAD-binding oxidoreductase [Crocinitomicaceae bacterium]|nr:FAD-binding oxidoreductase [Crocinitomicaceae bacterium]
MITFDKLSFWEKDTYTAEADFLIVGAGLVGYSTALSLRARYPHAKITILERGYLPSGASTKNAGFACFGSPSELLDDLEKMSENEVLSILQKRWDGLQILRSRLGDAAIDFQENASFELFREGEKYELEKTLSQIDFLNSFVEQAIGTKNTFEKVTPQLFPFGGVAGVLKNNYEGQIHTGKMMQKLYQLVISNNINVLFNISVTHWEDTDTMVNIFTNHGLLKTKKLMICTNGLVTNMIPSLPVQPARAQVLITKPLDKLNWKGTFHYDKGYYYFRNINNRILLGGGRNLDFEGETTTAFDNTDLIQNALTDLLEQVISPKTNVEIDYFWSGIMGVGNSKAPLVESVSPSVFVGVRMGGMGVAMGSKIGEELAELVAATQP